MEKQKQLKFVTKIKRRLSRSLKVAKEICDSGTVDSDAGKAVAKVLKKIRHESNLNSYNEPSIHGKNNVSCGKIPSRIRHKSIGNM